jgi:cation transport ATPase
MPEIIRLYNEGRLLKLPAEPWSLPALRTYSKTEQVLKLQVEGVRCAACGMRLKQSLLGEFTGMSSCDVEFESGRMVLTGKRLDSDALIGRIRQMGYSARIIQFQEEPPGSDL